MHRLPLLAMTALIVSHLVLPAGATPSIQLIDEWEGGQWGDVELEGDILFAAGYNDFLLAIDVSDPANPTRIANHVLADRAQDIEISGDYAYVAAYYSGLRIVDVTQPADMVEVGFEDSGTVSCVAVAGNYAYVGRPYDGVSVIDVSDPTAPAQVGHVSFTGATQKMRVQGDYVYVTVSYTDTQLKIIDVSDPTTPVVAGSYVRTESYSYLHGLSVAGDYAYIGGMLGVAGFWVVDVSDRSNPTLAAFRSVGECRDVTLQGNRAYVTSTSGLLVFDITTPTNPTQVGIGTYGEGDQVVVDGSHAYVTGYFRGMQVMDLSNEASPVQIATLRQVATSYSLQVEGTMMLLRRFENFSIADVTDPRRPDSRSVVGAYWGNGTETMDMDVDGDHVYLANCDSWNYGTGGLIIVNIADAWNPAFAGGYIGPDCLTAIEVSGNYAFGGGGSGFNYNDFYVYDISNPAIPALEATYNTGAPVRAFRLSGTYVYLANAGDGLRIMNVADPLNPVEAGTYSFAGNAWDVDVAGDYAYLACESTVPHTSLRVVDVSAPGTPVEVGSYTSTERANNIFYSDGIVFLTMNNGDLHAVDVSDPTLPAHVDTYTGGTVGRAATAGDYIYASASNHDGFHLLTFDVSSGAGESPGFHTALQPNYPNPFNPQTTIAFELADAAVVQLEVFDVRGRRVATLVDERLDAGPHQRTWDGTDDAGRRMSSGVYFYRLSTGGETLTRKLLLLK